MSMTQTDQTHPLLDSGVNTTNHNNYNNDGGDTDTHSASINSYSTDSGSILLNMWKEDYRQS